MKLLLFTFFFFLFFFFFLVVGGPKSVVGFLKWPEAPPHYGTGKCLKWCSFSWLMLYATPLNSFLAHLESSWKAWDHKWSTGQPKCGVSMSLKVTVCFFVFSLFKSSYNKQETMIYLLKIWQNLMGIPNDWETKYNGEQNIMAKRRRDGNSHQIKLIKIYCNAKELRCYEKNYTLTHAEKFGCETPWTLHVSVFKGLGGSIVKFISANISLWRFKHFLFN